MAVAQVYTFNMKHLQADKILAHLGTYLRSLPPYLDMLEEYYEVADQRMTVFRSPRHWVLFFEFVLYDARADEFMVNLWAFGDCLNDYNGGEERQEGNGLLWQFTRQPFASCSRTARGSFKARRNRFSILFKGECLKFKPTAEQYAAAGIKFTRAQQAPDAMLTPAQLLRFLCHHLDHPFFAGEDSLRSIIDACRRQRLAPLWHEMALLLQTREWRHPNIEEMAEPAAWEPFQILARTIATGDLTEWQAQNPATFNTHWSHWATDYEATEKLLHEERQRWHNKMQQLPPEARQQIEATLSNISQLPLSPGILYQSEIIIDGEKFTITPDYLVNSSETPDLEDEQ